MAPRRVLPRHPLLSAAHPVCFLYWQNRTEFPLDVVWGPPAAVVGGAAALWALLASVLRGVKRGAFVTSVAVLAGFSFGPLRELLLPLGGRLWGPAFGPGRLPLLAGAACVVCHGLCRCFSSALNLGATAPIVGVFAVPALGALGGGRPGPAPANCPTSSTSCSAATPVATRCARSTIATTAAGLAAQTRRLERAYADQVSYLSGAVQQLVDGILDTATRPTVVILHADHGPNIHTVPGDLQRTNVDERWSMLSAVYLPGRQYGALTPGTTPINCLRATLAAVWGLDLPSLPDRSYYSFLEAPYDFVPQRIPSP